MASTSSPSSANGAIQSKRLSNGIEVVVDRRPHSPAVSVQCWVEVGSIDESPELGQQGMAHYLEHMLFKGTPTRGVQDIAGAIEANGGEVNAYTSFDHTVFYATLGANDWRQGVDIISDIVGNSSLVEDEFERERGVILEEINRSLDSPSTRVAQEIFAKLYDGNEVGRPILGSTESVGAFKRDDVYDFYKRGYRPERLKVVLVGQVDAAKVFDAAESTFGQIARDEAGHEKVDDFHRFRKSAWERAQATGPRFKVMKGDYQQPRLEIAFPGPTLLDRETAPLDLGAFALGAGEMSRFTRRLRDDEGSVVAANASLFAPHFPESWGGLLSLSAYPMPGRCCDAIRGLVRETWKMKTVEPINAEEMARGQANLRAEKYFRAETVDGIARALGTGLRTPHGAGFEDLVAQWILDTDAAEVAPALERWFDPKKAVVGVLVPNESSLTEEEVAAAFEDGQAEAAKATKSTAAASTVDTRLIGNSPPVGGNVAVNPIQSGKDGCYVSSLGPGLDLIYRHIPEGQVFAMTLASEGGLRAESPETVGSYYAMTDMIGSGSKQMGYAPMVGTIEGLAAGLHGFSGKDSFGMQCECLVDQTSEILELFRQSFLEPVFADEAWAAVRQEVTQRLAAQNDSPANMAVRAFQEMIYGDHPYRYPLYGTNEAHAQLEKDGKEGLQRLFEKQRDSGPWVVAAAGPLSPEEARDRIGTVLRGFQATSGARKFANPPQSSYMADEGGAGGPRERQIEKDREQVHLIYGFPGLTWKDSQREALDVLTNILGGHGGRLFYRLRDRDSLAYTVTPVMGYGQDPGAVGAYIATSPEKREQAADGLRREMMALTAKAPSAEELERAKRYIIGTHGLGLQRTDSQTQTMTLMHLYGLGYDDFLRYPERVAKVTADDVVEVAKRLFVESRSVSVQVGQS